MKTLAILLLLLVAGAALHAAGPVYVVMWFDTEDYIEPAADDAVLRIAQELTSQGVRGTFKVVGEKARVMEQRGRWDVIRALALHEIGYHTNFHSIPPAPSLYMRDLGWLEGIAEFQRRESAGARDIERIFGVRPICFGQPGSSWAPQSNPALRRMGIPVYLDEGTQVGVGNQPVWYDGLLYIFNMGPYRMRAPLDRGGPIDKSYAEFDHAVSELAAGSGGVISVMYHPTEFVTTEFWDAANFSHGADRERADWQKPHRRTAEETERCFRILHEYVAHMRGVPGVRFITARQTFLTTEEGSLSAADMLLALLGMEPQVVDGPATRIASDYHEDTIARPAFERSKADAVSYIRTNHRLPAEVWIGSEKLSIGDFAATLAGDTGSGNVAVRRANLECEQYISNDPKGSFRWVIHPAGFSAPELLEMARLQAWTLKPARLR